MSKPKLQRAGPRPEARGLCFMVLGLVALTFQGCVLCRGLKPAHQIAKTSLDEQPPRMVSAFFGLESLPKRAVLIWRRAPGKCGMPVTFSRRVEGPIDPNAFTVVTKSGARLHPHFATTVPANELAERHTVLLIGELGNGPGDPPLTVTMTGSLALAGDADAKGLSVPVTPLADGPSLVLAYAVRPENLESAYPTGTKQMIVVVWAGGVRRVPGVTPDAHRRGYTVKTSNGDVVPIGLGNLGDGDNYEHLYLGTEDRALSVSMEAGLLMDPRDDPNPATQVEVAHPVYLGAETDKERE